MPALRACAAVACQSSGWFRRREVSSHARSRRAPVTGGGPARRRRWREVQEHNGVRGLPPHPDDAIGPRSPSMIHDSCAASWPGSCALIAASVSTARPGSQESLSSSVTGSPIRRAGTVGEAHCSSSLPCAAGRHCGGIAAMAFGPPTAVLGRGARSGGRATLTGPWPWGARCISGRHSSSVP